MAVTQASAPGAPGLDVVLASGGLATSLTVAFWLVFGHAITVAHEGGHALTALLLGGRVTRMTLNPDRTGATWSVTGPLRRLLVTMAGYTGPSVFGFLGAVVLSHGYPLAVLWGSVVLLVATLWVLANWFGRLLVVALGALLFWLARSDSTDLHQFAASTWIWLLLVGGLSHVLRHGRYGEDHASLRARTLIPTVVWAFLFTAVAVAAIGASGLILLGMMDPPM